MWRGPSAEKFPAQFMEPKGLGSAAASVIAREMRSTGCGPLPAACVAGVEDGTLAASRRCALGIRAERAGTVLAIVGTVLAIIDRVRSNVVILHADYAGLGRSRRHPFS